ncbi:hypothetical protein FH972_023273 [Carpinus fangiana]|uniref:Frequency clock protein n=1 Tax=Carpinus fangiana TaxID=176857 RepID=A0A5N6KVB9_9ROSI|nr:hypothetical protein FH972_023273 [Carpinus fangiana]
MSHPPPPPSTAAHARAPAAARRCPADQSVSLRRLPTQNVASRTLPEPAKPASAASSLINNRDSSGESSNVDNWFENSNNNLDRDAHSRIADKEPPFYLRHHSSTDSPLDNARFAAPLPSHLKHVQSSGSGSEEYRSVIDDLTIQMKKMKRKLRRYEQLHDPRLQAEKLFEVRVHGLPADKKRELEDLLRTFSANLNSTPDQVTTDKIGALASAAAAGKPTTSLTSTRFAADSGYGSMTTPNQMAKGSALPNGSSVAASGSQGGMVGASEVPGKDQNVRSFLHDLPQGLLQPPPSSLSETARKKLVVSRLEQIFNGRGALLEGSQQPLQQQEVSKEAASNDQSVDALHARGGEGAREARIMLFGPGGGSPDNANVSHGYGDGEDKQEPSEGASGSSSFLEQRPTRPLDLDPFRAQVASDNIEYIRHLGFSVPSKSSSPVDSEGWIYLNLLINMAQLHTINVTPAFVKHAVSDFSHQLELSADGRKVRWRAHSTQRHGLFTSNSNNHSGDSEENDSSTGASKDPMPGQKRSRSAFGGPGTNLGNEDSQSKRPALLATNEASFVYAPLFYRQSEDDDDASMADNESSTSSPDMVGELSAMASGTGHVSGPQRRGDGPIIFYNNSYFCTDLSGDRGEPTMDHISLDRQEQFTSKPLGVDMRGERKTSWGVRGAHGARYFREGGEAPAKKMSEVDAAQVTDIEFPSSSEGASRHVSFADESQTVDFEVCGLGGVTPADNLSITVTKELRPRLPRRKLSVMRPPRTRLDGVLERKAGASPGADKILHVRTTPLEPSALPEASMAYQSDESEDLSDAESSGTGVAPVGRKSPRRSSNFNHGFGSSASEASSEGSSVAAESGSQADVVDFLSLARKADPEAIRAREREYDAQMAERLAEDIPAGSSAATAGGGSNNNSPALIGAGGLQRQETTSGESSDDSAERSISS